MKKYLLSYLLVLVTGVGVFDGWAHQQQQPQTLARNQQDGGELDSDALLGQRESRKEGKRKARGKRKEKAKPQAKPRAKSQAEEFKFISLSYNSRNGSLVLILENNSGQALSFKGKLEVINQANGNTVVRGRSASTFAKASKGGKESYGFFISGLSPGRYTAKVMLNGTEFASTRFIIRSPGKKEIPSDPEFPVEDEGEFKIGGETHPPFRGGITFDGQSETDAEAKTLAAARVQDATAEASRAAHKAVSAVSAAEAAIAAAQAAKTASAVNEAMANAKKWLQVARLHVETVKSKAAEAEYQANIAGTPEAEHWASEVKGLHNRVDQSFKNADKLFITTQDSIFAARRAAATERHFELQREDIQRQAEQKRPQEEEKQREKDERPQVVSFKVVLPKDGFFPGPRSNSNNLLQYKSLETSDIPPVVITFRRNKTVKARTPGLKGMDVFYLSKIKKIYVSLELNNLVHDKDKEYSVQFTLSQDGEIKSRSTKHQVIVPKATSSFFVEGNFEGNAANKLPRNTGVYTLQVQIIDRARFGSSVPANTPVFAWKNIQIIND